ncbi:hypothetical protein CCAX7_006050 [Capsulimonas corticalis]|uniref:Uncharacterized protein n=1 Tax=Capsulimonas corticalis TaxID=2219043 RepID=A0A402D3E7_9BACT|nr:tetratricopeptide repeat protein [Capsulimonas corticalis]BDI28554.1 hypothetical protein CCAX7_006050 [Capsulimonas corticalis]
MNWLYFPSISVVGVIFLYHLIAFELLPSYYSRQLTSSPRYENPRALCQMERLVRLPAIGGRRWKQNAIFELAHAYRVQRRYEDAAEQYQSLLRHTDNWSFQATVHSRLAECMDGLNRPAEAAEHRAQATACSQTAFVTATVCLEQGRLLEVENRYREACEYYERGLPLAETSDIKNRLMAKLAIANFNAGNIADTVRWAEATIANKPIGSTLSVMHSMAGVAYRNMGDLAGAATHHERLYELVAAGKDPKKIAEALAKLATIQSFQGNFSEALNLCQRGRGAYPDGSRIVGMTEYGILMLLGRFEEARAALINSRGSDPLFIPRLEDRSSGLYALGIALLAAESGNVLEAREFYERGRRAFEGDEKNTLFADALGAWICALEGNRPDAQDQIAIVERNLPQCAGSRTTLLDVYIFLTKASLEMDDYTNALRYAERYWELKPYPSYHPLAYYLLGEARLGLGETEKAVDAYERGIALNLPTNAASKARVRLDQIQSSS